MTPQGQRPTYSDICTAKLCDRRGGRGHHSSVCATPVDKEAESPQEAVFAIMEGPGSEDGNLEILQSKCQRFKED